jgi:hypothetical protein
MGSAIAALPLLPPPLRVLSAAKSATVLLPTPQLDLEVFGAER